MNVATTDVRKPSVFTPAIHPNARFCILVYSPSPDAPPCATAFTTGDRQTALQAAQDVAESNPYLIVKLLDMVHLVAQRVN